MCSCPSLDQLMNIAFKYEAGLPLNPWSEIWPYPQSSFEASKNYRNLLALAYAHDNQEGFWIISHSMMLYEVA